MLDALPRGYLKRCCLIVFFVTQKGGYDSECKYTQLPFGRAWLRINREVVARFTNHREDGLAKCLQLAAKAAELTKWEGFVELLSKEEFESCD